jgi:hypothetical protein
LARSRFCRVCKDFHDLDEAWPSACVGHFGIKGDDAGFYVQSDTIDAFRSMADGRMYDSKSQYRRDLRSRGMVEIGNDRIEQTPTAPPPVRDALRQAYQQLRG